MAPEDCAEEGTMIPGIATEELPTFLATAVGSVPHIDPELAVDMILGALRTVPHTAQLPRCDSREQMWIQFSEKIPRFVVDTEHLAYFFDTSGDPHVEIERFYSEYLSIIEGGSAEYFSVGREYGRGIWALLDRFRADRTRLPLVKVQVTGPLSFAMTVTDETKKPVFYHPTFRDVAVKAMGLKAVWLMEVFRPFAERLIVFFDEPSLSAYGSSAFMAVSRGDVLEALNDVISMVLDRGGIPGIHCCGNTDWGLLMETDTRILSFDAVDYMESLSIYGREVSAFLDRGGMLAWGAVRNTDEVRNETADDVAHRVQSGAALLNKCGVDRSALFRRIMVTPACGCAGMTVADTQYLYSLLAKLESLGLEEFLKM
jgi:hypothetical protein